MSESVLEFVKVSSRNTSESPLQLRHNCITEWQAFNVTDYIDRTVLLISLLYYRSELGLAGFHRNT